jgi:hypothetical protein
MRLRSSAPDAQDGEELVEEVGVHGVVEPGGATEQHRQRVGTHVGPAERIDDDVAGGVGDRAVVAPSGSGDDGCGDGVVVTDLSAEFGELEPECPPTLPP